MVFKKYLDDRGIVPACINWLVGKGSLLSNSHDNSDKSSRIVRIQIPLYVLARAINWSRLIYNLEYKLPLYVLITVCI